MTRPPIRVLLVDDSPVALALLRRLLEPHAHVQIVGATTRAREALDLLPRVRPDVVCADLHMPDMDGLELTREIMATHPCPILVVSGKVGDRDAFRLLQAGAVDVFPKPLTADAAALAAASRELVARIQVVAGVKVFRRRAAAAPAREAAPARDVEPPAGRRVGVVAIGASTGGPQALGAILSRLPAEFPVPVLCVQHISRGFLPGFVAWLDAGTPLRVKVMEPGETPVAGTVYFARDDRHLVVDDAGRLQESHAPPQDGHRPSATVTFESVARRYAEASVGVLLTGMGADGASGLGAIHRAGGVTVAQDEATSLVFGMPARAIASGHVRHVAPLPEIPRILLALTARRA